MCCCCLLVRRSLLQLYIYCWSCVGDKHVNTEWIFVSEGCRTQYLHSALTGCDHVLFIFGDIFNHFVKNNKQLSTLVFSFSRFWSSPECFSWNMSEILLSRALHQRQAKLCWRETLPHSYYWGIVLWLSGSEAFRVVTHQNNLFGFGDPPPLVCVPETFWDYCNLTHGRYQTHKGGVCWRLIRLRL